MKVKKHVLIKSMLILKTADFPNENLFSKLRCSLRLKKVDVMYFQTCKNSLSVFKRIFFIIMHLDVSKFETVFV